MAQVGAGAGAGGGGAGGGGRDDRLKKKIDDTPLAADDDDEQDLLEGFNVEEEVPSRPANASGSAGSAVGYRGVRRYAPGDGSYKTTYVTCINSRDSPHNNRQIWLGRYYDAQAAAMAYDVFSVFNHHDTYVNFPELLHLYVRVVPRRGIAPDGTYLPITAADLERIKHVAIGFISAFFDDACAAIHTRRNHKSIPGADNPALTPQDRQCVSSLQAGYHTHIERTIRQDVLALIANQLPLAQQVVVAAQAGPSSSTRGAAPPILPLLPAWPAANMDFSSIQIPSSASQRPPAPTHIDFSAIQVPQYPAPLRLASTSGARLGDVRHSPTSPDRLRHLRTESSNTPSQDYSSLFAQNPFPQFASPSQIRPSLLEALYSPFLHQLESLPQFARTQTGHVSRPAATHVSSSPDVSFLRSLGILPEAAANAPQDRPNTLIRSNIERGTKEEGSTKRVSFEEDPSIKAAETRLNTERLRAERLNNEAAAMEPGSSPFPLLQRLRELSKAPYDQLYEPPQHEAGEARPRSSAPQLSAYVSPGRAKERLTWPLLGAHADPFLSSRGPGHEPLSRSAFSSYKTTDNVQAGGSSSNAPSVCDVIPIRARSPGDSAQREEEQRSVPLRRQAPQELLLYDVFDKQASATGEMATNAPSTSLTLHGPSTSNAEAPLAPSSVLGGLSQYERATSSRPVSTELTLARGELGPPFVRAPLLPDLNERAPEAASDEALRVVSTTSAPQAPINIRELQRLSTLGEGTSRQQEQAERSKPAEDNAKGEEKIEDK